VLKNFRLLFGDHAHRIFQLYIMWAGRRHCVERSNGAGGVAVGNGELWLSGQITLGMKATTAQTQQQPQQLATSHLRGQLLVHCQERERKSVRRRKGERKG